MGKIFGRIIGLLSRYGWTATLIILFLFAVGFTWSSSDELYTNIRLFDKAALTISSSYVESIRESGLIEAGIEGMVSKLDKYSKYLTGVEYQYLIQETDGEFEGIGISLEFHHDTLTIESVLNGTPAYFHGLKPGDRIIAIEGLPASELEISKIRNLLRGPKNSIVRLEIFRPEDGVIGFEIVRDVVEIKAIAFYGMADPEIGYIRLASFTSESPKEIQKAIRKLKNNGMRSLILDLRDNPGGLLLSAVEISSMFLPNGAEIVSTRGRDSSSAESYISDGADDFQNGGLVVLVNGHTASAAEILAGAIQDHDRGVVIGSPTFGKGLVQQILQFTENSALKLTTSKYFLPSGRCLQRPDWTSFELFEGKRGREDDTTFTTASGRLVFGGGGIMPDIYVEDDEASDYVDFLRNESCFFDFSLLYVRSHRVAPGFSVDDSIVENFRSFVDRNHLQFKGDDRQAFDYLCENLKTPNKAIQDALAVIDKNLQQKAKWQFDSHIGEIRRELQEAIVYHALGEEALYQRVLIPSQPEIAEARNILTDGDRYTSILVSN
jgi:carboxyl-terminal processing protease